MRPGCLSYGPFMAPFDGKDKKLAARLLIFLRREDDAAMSRRCRIDIASISAIEPSFIYDDAIYYFRAAVFFFADVAMIISYYLAS